MEFVAKSHTLKRQKERGLYTFLLALLIAAALFVPYIIDGRGYFIFFGDFNVQQIPFYKLCHAAVRSGNVSWSFTTDLGANFIGSYSFYLLGSPFFLLTLPFPTDFVPYLMGPLLILKFACAAYTSYLFIRRFTKTPAAAQLGALLYAFSGFSVYNIFFNHFHEAIIMFPLLLLSLDLLITENRRGVFGITVAACALVNYYFFFGMVIFTVIYYFVRLFMGSFKFKFSRFMWMVFEAVMGVGISCFLLIPSVLAILSNGRVSNFLIGWNAIMYGKEQIYLNILQCFFFPPDLPARPVFFPNANVKWSSLGGWLPIFGMTGVITWFCVKPKTWIKRLLVICIFMALVPVLNASFSAFNDCYYARWFYMPILIMCLCTALVSENATIEMSKGFRWAAPITIVTALVIGLFPQYDENKKIIFGLFTQDEDGTYFSRYWITVIIALIGLIVLGALIHLFKDNRKYFMRGAIIAVSIMSVIYGSVFIAMGRSHAYDIDTVMIDSLIEGNVNLDGNKDTFRIDTYDGVDNTAMYLGYSSINAFHSVVPPSVMEFYEYVGITRDVGSRPDKSYPALRPLLSVKYLLNHKTSKSFLSKEKKTLMPDYEYVKTSGNYYVYENKNYIPYGFSYDYCMTDSFCKRYDGKAKTRMMLKAMLLSKSDAAKYSEYIGNISELEGYVENVSPEDTQVFGELTVDGQIEEITEQVRTVDDKVNLFLTDEEMALDAKRLAATAAKDFKTGNGTFTATVERSKKSLVFFSIPFDSGWSATVNGKAVEIIKANVGFMAVPVESGTSTIEFTYTTPGLSLGILISMGSLLILGVYYVLITFSTNRKNSRKILLETLVGLPDAYEDEDEGEIKSILDSITEIKPETPKSSSPENGGFMINENSFDED